MNNDIITDSSSFKDWLFKDRQRKQVLFASAIAIIIQFAIFKYFYPYAGFIYADSYAYLDTAFNNFDINTYMVGYSRFLRIFSAFTSSDTALVGFQYVLIQTSALGFLFTIFYIYRPARATQILLLSFIVLNPLPLYLANYISSDPFFLAISFLWLTLLIWLIHRPTTSLVIWQAVVLFIAFTVRYNALIYPIILIIALALTKLPLRKKLIGFTVSLFMCGLFMIYTSYKYYKVTGHWQYAPFSGWQLANNAMYAYRYVNKEDRKPVPQKFKALDNMVREYFDSSRNIFTHPIERDKASTVYMWNRDLTLYKYRDQLFANDLTAFDFKKWASMGPFYKEYGTYLIKQYPWYYASFYLWPNANKYYALPLEFLGEYNCGKDSVLEVAQKWFGYKSLKVSTRTESKEVKLLEFYPILSGIANVIMFFGLISFGLMKGFKQHGPFRKAIILVGSIWILNAVFSIFASPAALRFQSFPILLAIIFNFLLIDWLIKIGKASDIELKGLYPDKRRKGKSSAPPTNESLAAITVKANSDQL